MKASSFWGCISLLCLWASITSTSYLNYLNAKKVKKMEKRLAAVEKKLQEGLVFKKGDSEIRIRVDDNGPVFIVKQGQDSVTISPSAVVLMRKNQENRIQMVLPNTASPMGGFEIYSPGLIPQRLHAVTVIDP